MSTWRDVRQRLSSPFESVTKTNDLRSTNIAERLLKWDNDTVKEYKKERAVLEAVADHRPRSLVEIIDEVNYHPIEIDRTCRQLHREEYIQRVRGGVYRLTPAGEQYLATRRASRDSEP